MDTNNFTLDAGGVSNVKFDLKDHSISSEKDWGGISSIVCKDGKCTITVNANRHGSETVAEWFVGEVSDGMAIACDTDDKQPNKLNFAFTGTLTFDHGDKTYICENVVIAQGHNARSRNNWWLGGPKMEGVQIAGLVGAIAESPQKPLLSKVYFVAPPGSVSHMDMGTISI